MADSDSVADQHELLAPFRCFHIVVDVGLELGLFDQYRLL